MENQNSFKNTVWTFGALYAILGILFMLINPPASDPKSTSTVILGFVALFLFIGLPVVAVWYYRNQGNAVSIGKAVKLGVFIGLLGGFIVGIYAYIYFAYINPEAVDKVLEVTRKILEEKGTFSEEMLDTQMEMTKKFYVPMQLVGNIFSGLLYGVIGGLLGGLFFKTPKEDY